MSGTPLKILEDVRMKKLFALLLAAMMVLSLAACGSKEEPAAEEKPAAEQPA